MCLFDTYDGHTLDLLRATYDPGILVRTFDMEVQRLKRAEEDQGEEVAGQSTSTDPKEDTQVEESKATAAGIV
jgi:hypothetical protein